MEKKEKKNDKIDGVEVSGKILESFMTGGTS